MEFTTITKNNPLVKENLFKKYTLQILKSLVYGLLVATVILFGIGSKPMIVSSGSMEPTLPVGSLVIVSKCDYEDLQLNDIVTMYSGGYYFTHRIIGKYNEDKSLTSEERMLVENILLPEDGEAYEKATYWVTMGDADNDGKHDGPLVRDIVGKVYEGHCWTWVGTCVRYVRQNYKMLMIMVVLLGVFAWVMDYFKDKVLENIEDSYNEDDEE